MRTQAPVDRGDVAERAKKNDESTRQWFILFPACRSLSAKDSNLAAYPRRQTLVVACFSGKRHK